MDRDRVAAWLTAYQEAWSTYDRARIAGLFSEDASYRYHPYDDPIRGRDAIIESWLEDRDEPGTYEGVYEPLLVAGDGAVATGTSTYRATDGSVDKVYDNCFVLRFDEGGRCTEFTEWYMLRSESSE